MFMCPAVLWKDQAGEPSLCLPGRALENQHLQLHHRPPEAETPSKTGKHGFLDYVPQKIPSSLPFHLLLSHKHSYFCLKKNWNFNAQVVSLTKASWNVPGEQRWGKKSREGREEEKTCQLWWQILQGGVGRAWQAFQHCPIAAGRRRVHRGYLKAPGFFPVSIALQKFCKGEGKKILSEKKVPLITKKLPFRDYFY